MATAASTKPKSTPKAKKPAAKETATEKAEKRNQEKQPLIKVAMDAMRKSDHPIHSKEFCTPKEEGGLGLMSERDQDWLYLQLLRMTQDDPKGSEVVKVSGPQGQRLATFDLREKNPQGWPVRGVDPVKQAAEEKAKKETEKKAKEQEKAKAEAAKTAKKPAAKKDQKVGTDGMPVPTQPTTPSQVARRAA